MPKAKRPSIMLAVAADSLTAQDLDLLSDGLCFVRGCSDFWQTLGMCKAHHTRFCKYGHPLAHGGRRHKHTDRVFRPKFRERKTWVSMWDRCTNSKHKAWHRYGGRGISVCERWRDFELFYADLGPKINGTSIERVDNDGNYEPSNCIWAPIGQQIRNTAVSKLNVDKVSRAKWRYQHGESYIKLAKEFGVGAGSMYAAVTGRSWKEVEARDGP